MISKLELAESIALPARCAAAGQFCVTFVVGHPPVAVSPVQHEPECEPFAIRCGSFRRSTAITVGLPLASLKLAYRLTRVFQSLIHADSGYALVYQRPLASALLPASERWLYRTNRTPSAPAALMTLSITCSAFSPFRSVLIAPLPFE